MDNNPTTQHAAVSSHVYVEADDEAPVKNTIRMVEGALEAFPSPEETYYTANYAFFTTRRLSIFQWHQELATQGGWVHAAPFLLSTGIHGGSADDWRLGADATLSTCQRSQSSQSTKA